MCSAAALLSAMPAVPAVAYAVAAEPIETIHVSGFRQAYRGSFAPLETPEAELVIGAQALENAGALDLTAGLDLSASVSRQNNFGGLWNAFAVRGFTGDENLPSNYLVNGFNAGRGFAGPRDISGIEAIEVLKGPKAAVYGRGEPGGTINLVTKRPTFETAGTFNVSYARFNALRLDGDYTTPLSDRIAIRLVGFYEDAESFRDTVESERYGFTPSLTVKLGDATKFIYELEYANQKLPFDRGVVAIDGDLEAIDRRTFLGEPGDGPMKAEVLGHQAEVHHDFDAAWSALLGFTYRDTSLEGYSTEPELSVGRQLLLVDGEHLTRQRRFRDYDATFTAVRAELAGEFTTGSLEHRLLFGADYDEFVNDQVFMRWRSPGLSSNPSLEQLNAINVFDPVYGQYALPDVAPQTDRKETQEAKGLYLQDQITLTDRLEVRLGIRFDDFKQTVENRLNTSVFEQAHDRFSPQVGAVYRLADTVSLYASYGEGFRQLTGADVNGNGFDPNTTSSVEAGVKVELNGGRLLGTLSVFQIKQDNILVGDPANPFSLIAAGEARSRGFEVDLTGELAEGLNMLLSYSYVDAEMRNSVLDPNFNYEVEAGDRLLNIPDHTLSAQLVKDFTIAERTLSLGGNVLHVGDRLGEVATDFELPSYTLVHLFAAFELTPSLRLRADIENLFNERYFTNSFSQLWLQPGAPRRWRLSASYRF